MRYSKGWDTEGKRNRLYGRKWRKARGAFLLSAPLCGMCKASGLTTPATVVDHVVPHKGDESLFWDQSNWQSLCEHHHNSQKAKDEIRGYSDRLGPDGWPLDPAHPANCGKEPVSGKTRPEELLPIAQLVFLVVGPPASGKTKWCRTNMESCDRLIDFDLIDEELHGKARLPGRLIVPILRERNRRLIEAASLSTGRVFLPITGASSFERDWWRSKLGNVKVVMLVATEQECRERIVGDPDREANAISEIAAVRRWFERHDRNRIDVLVENHTGGPLNHGKGSFGHPRFQSNPDLVSDVSEQNYSKLDDIGFA